jgi:(S)-sulfolactate dehydrogenase
MAEIVITEFMDESIVTQAFAGRSYIYDAALVDKPTELHRAMDGARALIVRNRTQVTAELLSKAPALQIVGRLGVGLDNIDLAACKARNIAVQPATGANDVAVAEYVLTAALVLLRKAWHATPAVVDGKWPRMSLIGREASGKVLGLLGLGAIARETATRARALGLRVCAHDPLLPAQHAAWALAEPVDLLTLFSTSDVLSLHVPLTPRTAGLVGGDLLARAKRGAILINAARGGITDDVAVVAMLKNGHLGGAALDVFAREPLDAAAAQLYRDVPNLLLTPHIAGVSEESNVRVSQVIADRVLQHLNR